MPSTQTLIQAGLPLIATTRLTPLKATVTWWVGDVVLPDAPVAVTTIDQRPVVSWSGVLNVPSSATGTSTAAGAGGGLAPALPALPGTAPS